MSIRVRVPKKRYTYNVRIEGVGTKTENKKKYAKHHIIVHERSTKVDKGSKGPYSTSESLGWEIWKDPVWEPLGEDLQQPPKVAVPPDYCRLSSLVGAIVTAKEEGGR